MESQENENILFMEPFCMYSSLRIKNDRRVLPLKFQK